MSEHPTYGKGLAPALTAMDTAVCRRLWGVVRWSFVRSTALVHQPLLSFGRSK